MRGLARALPLALLLGVLLWGVLHFAINFFGNFFRLAALTKDVRDLKQQVAAKRAERDALRARIEWSKTPLGAEAIGRRKGMVKAGEHALRMQVVPPKAPAPAAPAPKSNAAVVFWSSLTGAFVLGGGMLLLRRRARKRHARPDGALTPRSELRRRRYFPIHDDA